MEDITVFFVSLLFLGIVIVFIYFSVKEPDRQEENLRRAAEKFGGTVSKPWAEGFAITFTIDQVRCEVSLAGSQGQTALTRIHFQWTPPGNLRIKPQGFFARLGKALGAQDIKIGIPDFDGRYIIQGNPEPWVRATLDENLRTAQAL